MAKIKSWWHLNKRWLFGASALIGLWLIDVSIGKDYLTNGVITLTSLRVYHIGLYTAIISIIGLGIKWKT